MSDNIQLNRVLDAMRDGNWRSPAEISMLTGDSARSVTSRLRDLRLPRYGGYQVDARKRDASTQTWEYRVIVSNPAPTFNPPNLQSFGLLPGIRGATTIVANSGNQPTPITAYSSPTNDPTVRFLNILNLQVENIPKSRCRIDVSDGFDRVVALDNAGDIIQHLATTESTL
jgi:hypothetical protein